MDAINMIFENYGGERITRIFRTYWMALLILKQVMFSLFMVPPTIEPAPENFLKEERNEISHNPSKEADLSEFQFTRILLTLRLLEPEASTETGNTGKDHVNKKISNGTL